MRLYNVLNKNEFKIGDYCLTPIRYEDRFKIMQWRNEQIYHLRQNELLTIEKQEEYFNTTIASLFDETKPKQILFSFLNGNECVGYGGLVHINWIDQHAELSFIMATQLEDGFFKYNWSQFLALIELVAFGELNLHKIYTYAFDLRPHLYEVLEENGFKREAILNSHCLIEKEFKDVVIHSLVNKYINLRKVEKQDVDITYEWANNSIIRRYSLTQSVITQESHRNWFFAKLSDVNCYYFIAEKNNKPIGTFRLDIDSKGSGYISYLVDPKYHGEGFGGEILRRCVRFARENPKIINVVGEVMHENQASIRAFENLGFIRLKDYPDPIVFKLITS